eukprot:1140362-Pelagomonas_calceolata.AAC.2
MNGTLIHRKLQRHISLNCSYSPGMGNFNITIFNHFHKGIPLTAAYKDAVILNTATDPENLQGNASVLAVAALQP